MIVFWFVIALFVAGALLLLLPVLLRRDDVADGVPPGSTLLRLEQLSEAERDVAAGVLDAHLMPQLRREIEQRAREESMAAPPAWTTAPARRSAAVIAAALPLAALGLYLVLGRPSAVVPTLDAGQRHEVGAAQTEKVVTALAERLAAKPDDAEGWLLLGRSYTALGRFRDAGGAFKRASELLPGNANVMADVADVLAMAQGRRLAGEPSRWIQKALDADPRHAKALALAGTASFEAHDYAAAVGYWQRVLAVVPPDSPAARSTQGSIAQALSLERGDSAAVATPPANARTGDAAVQATAPRNDATPAAATTISGTVEIAPALAARVAPGATLFVFARAAEGPRMPLAIVRREGPTLPASFTLDDASAMAPGMRLSQQAAVVVGARLSRSGSATPQSGDLVGQSATLKPGVRGLRLVIDRVQP